MINRHHTSVISRSNDISNLGFNNWNIDADYMPLHDAFIQMITLKGEFANPKNKKRLLKEDLVEARNLFFHHAKSGGLVPFEVLLRYTDEYGQESSVLNRGNITEWDENDCPVYMSGYSIDITNFVTPKNLFDQNEQYKLTVDSINAGIWDWDITTGKAWWSDNFYLLLGYLPNEIEATYDTFLNILLHPDDREKMLDAISEHLERNRPYLLEVRMLHKDGNYYWFETSGKARVGANGKAVRMTGSIINRHKRKMLETDLKKYTKLVDEMSSLTKTGGWEYYGDGKKPLWTREIFDIHEIDYDKQPGLEEAINFYYGESKNKVTRIFTALLEMGTCYDEELEMITAKGKRIWVRTIGRPIINNKGKIIGATGTLQDITEKKQKEIELKQSNTVITAQNKRLQNFAHIVTHNLRSHAGNIQWVLSLIQDAKNEDERKEMQDLMGKISSSLDVTINDLGQIVSAECTEELSSENMSFKSVLSNVTNALVRTMNETKTQLDVDFERCATINYIPAYLESIIFNLVSNSIKYKHPERNPHISISTYMDGDRKCFSISDNGIGIDLDKYGEKIFGMYKTFHKHPDARGIGLYITKNMIEKFGGKISVNSKLGEGACFTIKF